MSSIAPNYRKTSKSPSDSIKESLGEYGSGWGWDKEYAHVFDQTNVYITVKNEKTGVDEQVPDDTPIRYTDNGTKQNYCYDDVERTDGEILNSGSYMTYQYSCKPHSDNAGNWYSWITATSGAGVVGENTKSSICPKGWRLPSSIEQDIYGWNNLIRNIYHITSTMDVEIRRTPLNFQNSGYYDSNTLSFVGRAYSGYQWSNMSYTNTNAYYFDYRSRFNNTQATINKNNGLSLRCVRTRKIFPKHLTFMLIYDTIGTYSGIPATPLLSRRGHFLFVQRQKSLFYTLEVVMRNILFYRIPSFKISFFHKHIISPKPSSDYKRKPR